MTTTNTFNFDTIVVHSGQFHTDDVLCVAMAKLINPDIRVERVPQITEEMTNDDKVIICDVGEGEFDHHQYDAKRRADSGEKYAACGLFLEAFWEELFPTEDTFRSFERDIIIPVELQDNKGAARAGNPLSILIGGLNPTNGEDADQAFLHAVSLVQELVLGQINAAIDKVRKHEQVVAPAMKKCQGTGILDLPEFGKLDYAHDAGFSFALYPSNRGGYNLQQVDESLPEAWLEEKPKGCTFVHAGRFLAAFETKEDALAAATPLVSASR